MLKYRTIENGSESHVYIRSGVMQDLERIDAVIFDCDGVLIDTKDSYDLAVLYTANRLTLKIMGLDNPGELYSRDDLYTLRSTGGFNNDWDLTYALVAYTFSLNRVEKIEKILIDASKRSIDTKLGYLEKRSNEYNPPEIDVLANNLNETGLKSLKRYFKENGLVDFVSVLDEFLVYPGGVGESLVTTMFEEVFCGADLYRKIYGREPVFFFEAEGLIENEKILVKESTLKKLSNYVEGKLGVASGSLKAQAEYVLKPFLAYLRRQACIWMDDVDEEERKTGRKSLHKPNPYSLIAAATALESEGVLYVGDTQADIIMARNAGKTLDVFFAGVYADTAKPEKTKTDFMKAGADLVMPSVNSLPLIFEEVK